MVEFSRHILNIAEFLLLLKYGCLNNKTVKVGFRYEIFVFFAENRLEVLIYYFYEL